MAEHRSLNFGRRVLSRAELTADVGDRLWQILALSLGRDWRKAGRVAFDTESAADQLQLYDAATVPKVDPSLPPEVTDVQFKSDLMGAVQISRIEAARRRQPV